VFDSKSKVEIEKANMVFLEVLGNRLNNPDKSTISIIMQRVAKNDVASKAREQGYDCLTLPMEFESKRKCVTSIGFEDTRKEDGELLFPERFSKEYVEGEKIRLPEAAYAAQMQQRPTAEGGGLIKTKEFRLYKELPQIISRAIFVDSAMKEKESADYTVMQCWGKSTDNKLYLIDQVREKMTAPRLKTNFLSFWAKHMQMNHHLYQSHSVRIYGGLNAAYVEDKASGTGLMQEIQLLGGIPIDGIIPNKDKYTRVYLITPIINAGMIYLPSTAEFLHDFIDECESFTDNDTHPYDDQIDGMVMAINKMIVENPTPWWQQVRG
jgi:predicted phage terminase large subunit-like protein